MLGPAQSSCSNLLVHLIIADLLIPLLSVKQRLDLHYSPACTVNFKLELKLLRLQPAGALPFPNACPMALSLLSYPSQLHNVL